MKKIVSILTVLCILVLLCACDGGNPAVTDTSSSSTSQTTAKVNKELKIKDGVLSLCRGQSDEDGVYTVPEGVSEVGELCFNGDTTMKKIIIPDSVERICSGAFAGCSGLVEVEMADSVKYIGSHAFYGCSMLEKIRLSNAIEVIEPFCFNYCTVLETVEIPAGVKSVGSEAFGYCYALSEIEIPASVEEIDSKAFYYCIALRDVEFESGSKLVSIGENAFDYCISLKKIALPSGLSEIRANCFSNCMALDDISIPSSVKRIGAFALNYTPWYELNDDDYLIVGDGVLIKCSVNAKYVSLDGKGIKAIGGGAFWNDAAALGMSSSAYGYKYADQLKTIAIPEGVTVIDDYAFYYCMSLTSVTLPSTLEYVGDEAFNLGYAETSDTEYYAALDIDLSSCERLKYIGENAFYGCSETDSVVLPSSVEHIGKDAFCMTKAYKNFYTQAMTRSECTFEVQNGILLWAYIPDGVTEIVIPGGVKMIAGGAFCGWDNVVVMLSPETLTSYWRAKFNLTNSVTSVVIPDGVEVIGDYAFYYIKNLTEITLPESVKQIGMMSFGRLENLKTVHLSGSLAEIGEYAFWSCTSLEEIALPESLVSVGDSAFYNCVSLKTVVFPENIAKIGQTVFSDSCTSLSHIYMPEQFKWRLYDILETPYVEIKVSYYIGK